MTNNLRVISIKIPEEVYMELALRVPEGERSDFIREAIIEKLERTPRPNKLLELEQRIAKLEGEFSKVRKYLAELEVISYSKGQINPYGFCKDSVDHKIIDYLIHYKGATTPELATYTNTNRWLVLNRLRRLEKTSKKTIGKPIVEYYAGEKSGKKRAWWINEELIEAKA
ncbi:MAG: hypothetical protein QW454_02615 [Candidatus Bathyarchaeia archaeon]